MTGEYKFTEGFLAPWRIPARLVEHCVLSAVAISELRDDQHTVLIGLVWWMGGKSLVQRRPPEESEAWRAPQGGGRLRAEGASASLAAALAEAGAGWGPASK